MNETEIESYLGVRHPFSAATHLIWCLVSVFVALLLWRLCRGERTKQLSVGCFGVSMVILYACSTFYHTVPASQPELVHLARKLDFSAIYLLIAGSYTPVFAVLLTGRLRRLMLSLVWGFAALGIACRWLLPLPPDELSMGLYLVTGLLGFLPARTVLRAVGPRGVTWALTGCVFYTLGGLCDALHWPVLVPGWIAGHEMLHLFDIAATLTHIYFVVRYVIPYPMEEPVPRLAKRDWRSLAEVHES